VKRAEFTCKVADLILWILSQGWGPLLDYALRSAEEQQRLFAAGKSKCDGVYTLSGHQYGAISGRFAVDIYIRDAASSTENRDLYEKAHQYWESLGGRPMIEWDLDHFEVR
jgi:hypothetical protein